MARLMSFLLWVWVLGAFAAFMIQFRHIAGPALRSLGLI